MIRLLLNPISCDGYLCDETDESKYMSVEFDEKSRIITVVNNNDKLSPSGAFRIASPYPRFGDVYMVTKQQEDKIIAAVGWQVYQADGILRDRLFEKENWRPSSLESELIWMALDPSFKMF